MRLLKRRGGGCFGDKPRNISPFIGNQIRNKETTMTLTKKLADTFPLMKIFGQIVIIKRRFDGPLSLGWAISCSLCPTQARTFSIKALSHSQSSRIIYWHSNYNNFYALKSLYNQIFPSRQNNPQIITRKNNFYCCMFGLGVVGKVPVPNYSDSNQLLRRLQGLVN